LLVAGWHGWRLPGVLVVIAPVSDMPRRAIWDAGRFASSGVNTGHRTSGPAQAVSGGPVVLQDPAGQRLPGLV